GMDADVVGPRCPGPAHRAYRHVHDEPRACSCSRAQPGGRGPRGAGRMIRLDDYRHVAPPGVVDIIQRLSERVRDRRILHLSAGRFGEGPAEMLSTSVPLFQDLGLDTRWEITGGDATFYATASAL